MDPVNPTRRWAGRALVAVAALALLAALWPNARSLYDLTGEELSLIHISEPTRPY